MREIILDTETTGLDPEKGDRVIEIACLELLNHLPTGRFLQYYINPERLVPADAVAIHGITSEFLVDKPKFPEIIGSFLEFIADSPFVIHNADFDIRFLNAELTRVKHPPFPLSRSVDTILLARQKFPGAPASLDALCRRFNIDTSHRAKHGALVDCQLLAQVYLELRGGRQKGFALDSLESSHHSLTKPQVRKNFSRKLIIPPSPNEDADHQHVLQKLRKALWFHLK